jgi:hypothetical protein
VPQARVPRSQPAGGDHVRAGTQAREQPGLASQAAHLDDRHDAVHRDHLVDGVLVPGEDPGDEAVGYALDEVPANLAAHQGAQFVGLDDDGPAGSVALAEALSHADDNAPGADPANHCVRDHAIWQPGERLRAELGAVQLSVPLRIELLRREVSGLPPSSATMASTSLTWKSPSIITCAPQRRSATRSPPRSSARWT